MPPTIENLKQIREITKKSFENEVHVPGHSHENTINKYSLKEEKIVQTYLGFDINCLDMFQQTNEMS